MITSRCSLWQPRKPAQDSKTERREGRKPEQKHTKHASLTQRKKQIKTHLLSQTQVSDAGVVTLPHFESLISNMFYTGSVKIMSESPSHYRIIWAANLFRPALDQEHSHNCPEGESDPKSAQLSSNASRSILRYL